MWRAGIIFLQLLLLGNFSENHGLHTFIGYFKKIQLDVPISCTWICPTSLLPNVPKRQSTALKSFLGLCLICRSDLQSQINIFFFFNIWWMESTCSKLSHLTGNSILAASEPVFWKYMFDFPVQSIKSSRCLWMPPEGDPDCWSFTCLSFNNICQNKQFVFS